MRFLQPAWKQLRTEFSAVEGKKIMRRSVKICRRESENPWKLKVVMVQNF